MGWAIYSFYPIAVFPVLEAPRWLKGYTVDLLFIIGCWLTLMLGFWLQKRDEKKEAILAERDEENFKAREIEQGEDTSSVKETDKQAMN